MSVTGGLPKELLPLGSKPVLARILDEAREAGVDGAVIVNGRAKIQIDDAIDEWSHTTFADMPLKVSYQEEARGLGHAVAAGLVDDDALVLLGDVVYFGGSPMTRMANLIHRGIDGCVAVEPVSEADMHLYGVVEFDEFTGCVSRIREKPSPADTESRWAVAGRFAFSQAFMSFITDYCEDPVRLSQPAEINLTEIINSAVSKGMDFRAVAVQPGQERVDCGSVQEYATARKMDWD